MTIKFFPYMKKIGECYIEIGQHNNLRWTYLYKNEAGDFEEQSMMFKCKDFFNDIVAKYNGMNVKVYGMDTKNIKTNEEGQYIKLKFVQPAFLENVGSINKYTAEWAMPPIDVQEVGIEDGEARCLLFIPREYFDNTYFISLLTYLIRVSNINKPIDATFAEHPTKRADNPFKDWYDKVIKGGFTLPMEAPEKFYVNTNETYIDAPIKIHNCGCAAWHTMAKWYASQAGATAAAEEVFA